MHIGNARTAIINALIAKKYNAEFILRIEDTDLERSTKESEKSIFFDLKWLGIEWTEGPDLGGNHAPYRQSERFDIYKKYTDKLLADGKAYHCYCTQEELDAERAECEKSGTSFVYSGKCRHLSDADKKAKETAGIKPTVRLHIPEGQSIDVDDGIKGMVHFSSENIGGDFIITRSDGVPIYNYIVVIDDYLMEVTHVIRGEDHLPNTPKQIMVLRALGVPEPKYAHLPLVLGDDKKKLSKRHGITSVENYRAEGYLPEALVNYIATLGWSSKSGEEILSFDRLAQEIDIDSLGKSAAVFDFQKLRWMNGQYIKSYDPDKIIDLFAPYLAKAGYDIQLIDKAKLRAIIDILKPKCELLADIAEHAAMFFRETPEPDAEALECITSDAGQKALKTSAEIIGTFTTDEEFTAGFVNAVKEKSGLKGKDLFHSLRAIITSSLKGPDLAEAMKIIGKSVCEKRIENILKRFSK